MKFFLFALAALASLCGASAAAAAGGQSENSSRAAVDDRPKDFNVTDWIMKLNLDEIVNKCNQSFKVDPEYLKSLNDSGSFPDETDKTPKCYIHCYLMGTGMMREDGEFCEDVSSALFAGERNGRPMADVGDIVEECADKREETCLCEKAYNFVKCIMETEIDRYEN